MADAKVSALDPVDEVTADDYMLVTDDPSGTPTSKRATVGQLREAIRGINAQTGTTYTLVRADAGKLVTCTNASAITVTVPPNSSVAFPVGAVVNIMQGGAGQVSVAAGSGVTVNRAATFTAATAEQYADVTLVQTAADTWVLFGGLAAA